MKKIIFISLFLVGISCKRNKGASEISLGEVFEISTLETENEGAFLADGLNNEKFICWTEEYSTGNIFVYKRYKDHVFMEKVVVPTTLGLQSHHESMAKLGVTKEGLIFCLFRVANPTKMNKYGGTLFYTTSKDNGKNWSEREKLVLEEESTSQSFFDIERMKNGELAIVWLDNRFSTREKRGSTLFFNHTTFGKIVEKETPIAFNTCQCCRTDLLVDGAELKIAFRNIVGKNIRDMFFISSSDGGVSFNEAKRISSDNWELDGCPHTGPSLAVSGSTAAVWFTAGKGNKGLFFAEKKNKTAGFGKRIEISENGNHPQMTFAKGNYYVVYDAYYTKANTTFQQIKLLKKNIFASDEIISLAMDETMNSHPVISKISENELLVVWTKLDGRNKQIQAIKINI